MKKILRLLRRILNTGLGKDFFEKKDCVVATERFGSVYGGWSIIPLEINSSSIVYSFGVGEDISFDVAIIDKFGVTVNAFDPTPKSIKWVKSKGTPKNFLLNEYGIADYDGEAKFFPPENPDYMSYSVIKKENAKEQPIIVKMKKLETIMKELGHTHIDILKMDVEGSEYSVIDNIRVSDVGQNRF